MRAARVLPASLWALCALLPFVSFADATCVRMATFGMGCRRVGGGTEGDDVMEPMASLGGMSLAGIIDHTNLRQDATSADVARLCEEAVEHGFATVCVNSCWTGLAAGLLRGSGVGVTTVVGFPLGAMSTAGKVAETLSAVGDGATEIDMVMNVGQLKDGNDLFVESEIASVVMAARPALVKVIIECCLLTDDEIVRACEAAVMAGADFVKTSTGFSTGGATVDDVRLMRRVVGNRCKVKAAGGIHTREEALAMVEAGADRIGTSAGMSIVGMG